MIFDCISLGAFNLHNYRDETCIRKKFKKINIYLFARGSKSWGRVFVSLPPITEGFTRYNTQL